MRREGSGMKSVGLPIPVIPPGGTIDELTFMDQLRRAVSAPGRKTRVARQNVGRVVTRDRAGKRTGVFNAGPMVGAADLSGIASVTISGVVLGIRLEVEVKVDAPWTEEQQAYAAAINRMGGVALCVRYSHAKSLAENVIDGVAQVDAAIVVRIAPLVSVPLV
jgi:hypothetical protein